MSRSAGIARNTQTPSDRTQSVVDVPICRAVFPGDARALSERTREADDR